MIHYKAIKTGSSLLAGLLGLLVLLLFQPAMAERHNSPLMPEDTSTSEADTATADSTQQFVADSLIGSSALKEKVDYKAKDSVIFNLKQEQATLYNKAVVNYKQKKLESGKIMLNWATNLVQARGLKDSNELKQKPVFTEKQQEFRTDSMDYNFSSEKGKLYNLRTEQAQGYLHGEEVKKGKYDVAYASKAKYTTCDKPDPHFYLAANKIKTIPGDKIISGPANIVVGGVPLPIVLPFGFFPNTSSRSSGLIFPSYGEADQRGFFLKDLGYYTGISDQMDLKLMGTLYSKGSWNGRIETNYKKRYKYDGNLALTFGRNVYGEEGDPEFRNTRSYAIKWNHNQSNTAHPYRTFSASVNISSIDNRRNRLEGPSSRLRNQLRSTVNYSHSLPRSIFSQLNLSAQNTQNLNQGSFDLTLPSGNLSTRRLQPFKGSDAAILSNVGVTYDLQFRNELSTGDSVLFEPETWNQWEYGAQQSANVSTSFNLLTYLSVSPNLRYTERLFFEKLDQQYVQQEDTAFVQENIQSGLFSAREYSVSANLSTNLYGTFNINQFGISAIRHAVNPSVNFSYQPDFSDQRFGNYDTYFGRNGDRQRYFRYQGPYGAVSSGAQGNMGINIKNNIEMKVRKETDTGTRLEKVSLIDQLRLSTNYNFLKDSFQLSNISIKARTKLLDAIQVNFDATLDPYYYNPADSTRERSYALARSGSFGRITRYRVNLSSSLNPKTFNSDKDDNQSLGLQPYGAANYVDFDVPWNLNLNYNLQFSNRNMEKEITTNSIRAGGDLSLTKKLKIGSNITYNIRDKQFEPTRVSVNRDLHCWQMSFEWAPFSQRSFYMFSISAKSSVLRDLEYEQRNQRF